MAPLIGRLMQGIVFIMVVEHCRADVIMTGELALQA